MSHRPGILGAVLFVCGAACVSPLEVPSPGFEGGDTVYVFNWQGELA